MGYEGGLIGEHPSLHEVRRLIARVAASSARAVLIYGETGTGKGVVARLVHQQSSSARQDFVDVNCAAIPDESDGVRTLRAREGRLHRRRRQARPG